MGDVDMNDVVRGRMRRGRLRVVPGESVSDAMHRYRGVARPFVPDATLDALAELQADDPARFYSLAPDVRDTVDRYVAARAAATPEDAA